MLSGLTLIHQGLQTTYIGNIKKKVYLQIECF